MRFSTKCWSEHILSAYKATKDLKHPLYMTFNGASDHDVTVYIMGRHVIPCDFLANFFFFFFFFFLHNLTDMDANV